MPAVQGLQSPSLEPSQLGIYATGRVQHPLSLTFCLQAERMQEEQRCAEPENQRLAAVIASHPPDHLVSSCVLPPSTQMNLALKYDREILTVSPCRQLQ